MSLLRFNINDYHAISHADIKIDGITVLAGENGSGKSTLSRWIYYMINSMVDFEETSYFRLFDDLNSRLVKFYRFSPDSEFRDALYSFEIKSSQDGEDFLAYVSRVIDILQKNLIALLYRDTSSLSRKRLMSLVGLEPQAHLENSELEDLIIAHLAKLYDKYVEKYFQVQDQVDSMRLDDLYESMAYSFHMTEDLPNNFHLYENEESLMREGRFVEPYFVNKALYIDSSIPMSQTTRPNEDAIGQITRNLIHNSTSAELDLRAKGILLKMMHVIKGTIALKEDKSTYGSTKELRYRRRDGLDIPLRNAASGIQAIAYLYRLLECGFLDSETLLLIDEPETHLHPQWVVEYANILVYLHKDLGVKIIIASHSPDMISAIETISRRHELEDVTRFYQAKQDQNLKYTFEDLETNIAGIFESFNVAFSKMQDYGAADL